VCLGGMTFGEPDASSMMHGAASPAAVAHQILDRAVDAGVNFVDVADVYGNDGLAERVLGDWFVKTGKRDRVVLATKFRFRMGEGVNGTGASRHRILRCAEDSLRRLQTDRLDLFQIHAQDLEVAEDETLRALDDLVRQGKVLYIGCSNYAAYRLVAALWTSERERLERFVTLQAQYSLAVRDLEREHMPLCTKFGLGILPWSPLAGGFLTGKYRKDQPPPAGSRFDAESWKRSLARYDNPRNWRILEALDGVAKDVGASLTAVALAWLLHKPAVTSVIFGARTPEQLEDNLKAADLRLSPEQVAALDTASAFELGYPYDFLGRMTGGKW
jgi:aryl-alcohol dehydrogenase-like predicted oxidoreductase